MLNCDEVLDKQKELFELFKIYSGEGNIIKINRKTLYIILIDTLDYYI